MVIIMVAVVMVSNFLVSEESRDYFSPFSSKLCSNIATTLRKPDLPELWIEQVKERL